MILGIETSCDDTCAAVYDPGDDRLLSNVVSSQVELHAPYQGVVPELASRRHASLINTVLRQSMEEAGVSWSDLSSVAVTHGPGLVGSLLTGIAAGKSISAVHNLPLIPVNHLQAHVFSQLLEEPLEYPFLSLVVSGGHSFLARVDGPHRMDVIGRTRDDAAGEAFDKVAKMLDLGYPGGPRIQAHAEQGNPHAIDFPRPTLEGNNRWNWHIEHFDFSFSGIKTAVLYHLRDHPDATSEDVAASFQQAMVDCLVYKSLRAAEEHDLHRVVLGGGVAANRPLRETFLERTESRGISVHLPPLDLCTDNAAMIARRAADLDRRADFTLNAQPSAGLLDQPGTGFESVPA